MNISIVGLIGLKVSERLLGVVFGKDIVGLAFDLRKIIRERNPLAGIEKDDKAIIEKITKSVSDRVIKTLENAGELRNGEVAKSVVQDIADIFSKNDIAVEQLIDVNLDPQELKRSLLRSSHRKATQHSDDENEIFEIVLGEICSSMTRAASCLSGFNTLFASKVLITEQKVVDALVKNMEGARKEKDDFEEKYRRVLCERLDRMELFGVARVDEMSRRQRLSIAYINLNSSPVIAEEVRGKHGNTDENETISSAGSVLRETLSTRGNRTSGTGSSRIEELRSKFDEMVASHAVKADPIQVVLSSGRRFAIYGQAGSGKTTLLQWIAVRAANSDFPKPLGAWNDCVPFFVRLREFVDVGFPVVTDLPKCIAPVIAGTMPNGWVSGLLSMGRAVVLIDGIDELPSTKREPMLERLAEMVQAYPLCRYVITSRPYAVNQSVWPRWNSWLRDQQFYCTSLREMTPVQTDELIDHWHRALSVAEPEFEDEVDELADGLKEQLRSKQQLQILATNPLLCSMICALYRERRQNLPAERLRLYRECVDMLLNRRDAGRKINLLDDYPDLGEMQKERLIESFAYWMQKNGYSEVPIETADSHFDGMLRLMDISDVNGLTCRRFFVERACIVREPTIGQIDFTHRTFQEYLAAKAALDAADFGVLMEHVDDDLWRETIILAIGLARPEERNSFLSALTKDKGRSRDKKRKHRRVLLALACLETKLEISPSIRAQIIGSAKSVVPPNDEDEARMVAQGGEPAIALLKYDEKHTIREKVMSIAALELIGGRRAMEALSDYSGHSSPTVARRLCGAWKRFNRESFARRVLSNEEWIFVSRVDSLDGFGSLNQMRTLFIEDCNIESVQALVSHEQLEEVSLIDAEVASLGVLASLRSLRQLSVIRTNHRSPGALGMGFFEGYEFFVHNLKGFDLSPGSANDAVPEESDGLQIVLRGGIADVSFLAEFVDARTVDASFSSLDSLTPMSTWKRLESLSLQATSVREIDSGPSLKNLKILNINDTEIDDLSALDSLTELRVLFANNAGIDDFGFIDRMSELTVFVTNHTDGVMLYKLGNLSKLKYLELVGPQKPASSSSNRIEIPIEKPYPLPVVLQSVLGNRFTDPYSFALSRKGFRGYPWAPFDPDTFLQFVTNSKDEGVFVRAMGTYDIRALRKLSCHKTLDLTYHASNDIDISNIRGIRKIILRKDQVMKGASNAKVVRVSSEDAFAVIGTFDRPTKLSIVSRR